MQPELVAANGRRFPGFAAAVLVFIVDPATRRFLVLSSPAKRGRPGWEIVNGGMEADETPMAAVAREVAEEAGPEVRLRVLGAVHTWSWRYDDQVTQLLSMAYVATYLGGEIVPGDDMAGSQVWWASLDELEGETLIPGGGVWMFERALQCFDLWSAVDPDELDGWEHGA